MVRASASWILPELLRFGLQRSNVEKCACFHLNNNRITIVITYVDDVLVVSNNIEFVREFFQKLQKLQSAYRAKIVCNPKIFVGIEIEYFPDGISLSQTNYIHKITKLFCMNKFNPVLSPMEFGLNLEISTVENDNPEFRSIIGALLYVARYSRPDINFAVNKLSRHQNHVTETLKF